VPAGVAHQPTTSLRRTNAQLLRATSKVCLREDNAQTAITSSALCRAAKCNTDTFLSKRTALARPPRNKSASCELQAEVEEIALKPKEKRSTFDKAVLMQ
jgi:hypothetical protein